MRAVLLGVTLMLWGCTKSNTVQCGDITCPAATHCGPMNECVPDLCGNDRVDDLEECDGSVDTATVRCTDYGFYKGPDLTCSETCVVDTSACSEFCGDHQINGIERCDGIPATGAACADFGFDVGTIGCTDGCAPAFDYCSNIGWQLVPGGATDELYAVYLASAESGVAVGRTGQIIAAKDGVWIPITSPTTQDLNGVYGNTGTIIAVGNAGTIVRYDGTTASLMSAPTTEHLFGISGTAAGALAVGANGTILRFNGTTWTQMTSPVNVALTAVFMISPISAYAVGAAGTVLKLQGNSWSQLTVANLPAEDLFAVFVVNGSMGDAVFVAGNDTTVARIVNDNTAIVPPTPVGPIFPLRTIWGTSASDVFVAGANGTILHWNGSYFTVQDSPTNRTIYGMQGAGNRIVAVTRGGSVIAFNGTSRHVETNLTEGVLAIHNDGTRVVAAGDRQILRLRTSGLSAGSWERQAVPGLAFHSVFALGNDVYACDLQTGLYKSTAEATPQQILTAGVNAVWATSSPLPLRVIAVGANVWESTNGTSFPGTPSSVVNGTNILRGIWASADGVWYAVGDNGFAMRRTAGAPDWTPIPTGTTERLFGVWGASTDDVFAVGEHGTILHWNGTAWRGMYTGIAEHLYSISGNTGADVFVVGTSFTRLHYDGINWSRMASYGFDGAGVSTHRGTTYYISGGRIERFSREQTLLEGRCGDAFDNDSDGRTNCDDPECVEDPQCRRGGACETLERVTCETTALETSTYTGVARLDDLPCLDHSTPGPEASFRYVAEESGSVTVTIDDASGLLDLVVIDAALGHCVLDTCRPATASGGKQTVTFATTAGQMYYLVVDGPVGVGAPFALTVSCN